jgi:hypothetical protein
MKYHTWRLKKYYKWPVLHIITPFKLVEISFRNTNHVFTWSK